MASISQRPLSPTLSETTTRASEFEFGGKVITRADLRTSIQTYEQLLSASQAYSAALLSLSSATATFADAIHACANLKGSEFTTTCRNSASAGFHYLLANHLHILADAIERQFLRPLTSQLSQYTVEVTERSVKYEKSLRESSRIIHQTEEQNAKLGRAKERNMTSFKASLNILQNQVQEIDRLKTEHYTEVQEHEAKFAEAVQGKVAVVIRSAFEIFERLTAKSTDPIMEAMLQSIPDPFESYGSPIENRLFSVLQPLSLLSEDSPSSATSTHSPRLQPVWMASNAEDLVDQKPDIRQADSSAELTESPNSMIMQDSKSELWKGSNEQNLGLVMDVSPRSPAGTIKAKTKPTTNLIN